MKQAMLRSVAAFVLLTMGAALAFGQTTGSLSGTVTDQSGAVVAGASVLVKNNDTGVEQTVEASDSGTFNVPALPAGTYTVTITAPNFKKAVLQDVKINVGTPSSVNIGLEVGAVTESVTITGAGGELLQTQTATVGTTITGRQITDLPFASRDALDLVLLLPGTQTPGRPRTSSVNGLPKGGLNITLDGVNVQDNLLKSSDGFFTYIRPRIDAIDEVTVSTATPGAESSGEGAVQIKFVTRAGTNDLTGSLYWYHRNPVFNANYWFNNRDLPPDESGKAPRTRILLNQYGARVGGPVRIPGLFDGRDKAFFFVNYEEFRLPEQTPIRNRTILTPLAETGVYTYVAPRAATLPTGCSATSATQMTCTRNLFTIAGAAGLANNSPDPTVASLLSAIRASTAGGGISPITNDPNRQRFSFINPGGQVRYFPTVRLDANITKNHHIENIWNYQAFRNTVDFLNNIDPAFPGFPNFGGQNSNRFSNTTALRSTLTNQLVNEARFGLTGGTSLFSDGVNAGQFANQGGFSIGLGSGLTGATVRNSTERRNSPVKNFSDTLTYVTGNHNINFGGSFDQINFWRVTEGVVVPTITLGFDATRDTVLANAITAASLPGASAAQLTEARNLYATLSGRVTAVGRSAFLNEETEQYEINGPLTTRYRQRQFGLFAQDSWRYRPNLTLNFGLRYEPQYPFVPLNNVLTFVPYEQLFGTSGVNGLFRPGATGGTASTFNRISAGENPFAPDKNNFAPSVGFAYSPDWKNGILNRVFGSGGQSVLRGGYSIAYIREAGSIVLSILGANRGATIPASRTTADTVASGLNLPVGTLFRDRAALFAPNIAPTQTFPDPGLQTEAVNGFEPDLKTGYAQSWSASFQREITKDMVFEARYVGTRGVKLWQQMNLNEVNVIENGFLNEFRLAQQNLQANLNAPTSFFGANDPRRQSIAFTGAPGTVPIPIIFQNLVANQRVVANAACPVVSATNPACYNTVNAAGAFTGVGLFNNATVLSAFNAFSPSALGLAGILSNAGNNSIFRPNRDSWGLPANFFRLNGDKLGGVFVVTNNGRSWYDALTLEMRRRMSRGLLIQGSYTWSKSMTNMYASNSDLFAQPITLRDRTLDKVESPFDIRHAFKVNWIYELPFGRGQKFFGDSNGFVNQLTGGWEVHGTARVQSGSPISLGNVQLVNMTKEELQDAIDIRRGTNVVTWLPDDIIANTQAAFNTTLTGFSAQFGAPQAGARYIAPANSNGCIQGFGGQCGFSNLVLWGPKFARVDMSIVKKFRFTETKNIEFRTELLNAFNNINFLIGAPANDVNALAVGGATFGQVTNAYNDLSTTNDPGGRLVQFVLRLNF
jgi:hypothetical protein